MKVYNRIPTNCEANRVVGSLCVYLFPLEANPTLYIESISSCYGITLQENNKQQLKLGPFIIMNIF